MKVGMFRKLKLIVLVFILGLIFLGINTTSVQAQVDSDDFPIGMFLDYNVDVEQHEGPDYEFTIKYEFLEWTDHDQLIVLCAIGATYESIDFSSIRFGSPDHPRLWMDVSTWQLHDFFTMNGYLYEFTTIENKWISSLGNIECYRLEYEIWDGPIRTESILWYHEQLGIILQSDYVTEDLAEGLWSDTHNYSLLDSNLIEFNPPNFTDTATTSSTSTTTETTSTTITSTTSRVTTPYYIDARTELDVILVVGISIEIFLIILLLRSKKLQ